MAGNTFIYQSPKLWLNIPITLKEYTQTFIRKVKQIILIEY